MIDSDKEGFFTALEQKKKWAYSYDEQEIIFRKIPQGITYQEFMEVIIKNTGKTKPFPQKLIDLAWTVFKKNKTLNKTQTKLYEGCNNCISGYIKVPNLFAHTTPRFEEETKEFSGLTGQMSYKVGNLNELMMYPMSRILCTCTQSRKLIDYLEDLKNLYYSEYRVYEFAYVSIFAFCKYYLNPIRFKEFNGFNPFEIWGVSFEDCHVLLQRDLKFFGNIIDHIPVKKKPKPKLMFEDFANPPEEATYNKKIY